MLLQGERVLQLKSAKVFIFLRRISTPRCLLTGEYLYASVTYSTGVEGYLYCFKGYIVKSNSDYG